MAWLETWARRRKITISNENVDEDLSSFSILISLSASSGIGSADVTDVFDLLGGDANRKRIAVTTSDGTTQCYAEIERFDYASEEAWLWVKVPLVSCTVDTVLYLYYDSTQDDNTAYIGDTGDVAAQNVWDSDYVMVQHMGDATTSTIAGSTTNNNSGSKVAANQPIEATGKIGRAQNYTGAGNLISVPLNNIFDMEAGVGFTFSVIIKATAVDAVQTIYSLRHSGTSASYFIISVTDTAKIRVQIADNSRTSVLFAESTATLLSGAYYDLTITRGTDGTVKIWIDGVAESVGNIIGHLTNADQGPYIGNHYYSSAQHLSFNGIIDELKVSSTTRSAAWIRADRYNNQDGLVTFDDDAALSGGGIETTLPVISAELIEGNLLDTTLPVITAEFTGGGGGFLEITLPSIAAEVAGSQSGAILTTLPAITANLEGNTTPVALAATLPALTAEIQGGNGGLLEASLPAITSSIKGGAILEATLPAITASLEGDVEVSGNLIVSLPAITANVEGKTDVHGDLACTLQAITAELTGTVEVGGNLACALPMITAELTGFQDISGDLVATLPMITALIEGTTGLADDDGDPIDADECGVILRYSKVGY